MERQHLLSGLDPQKFVAWMAAMGTLRLAATALGEEAVTLHWDRVSARPILKTEDGPADSEELCRLLAIELGAFGRAVTEALPGVKHIHDIPQAEMGRLLDASVSAVEMAPDAMERRRARLFLDWVSALAFDGSYTETIFKDDDGRSKSKMVYALNPLVMIGNSGGGFISNAATAAAVNDGILQASLFGFWTYARAPGGRAADDQFGGGLNWDPQEQLNTIRLGIAAKTESNKPYERGATLLAMAGFASCPALPIAAGRHASTPARKTAWGDDVVWPLWDVPLGVREALAMAHDATLDTGSYVRMRAAVTAPSNGRFLTGLGRPEA